MDSTIALPKGIYHDRIIRADGELIDLGWRSNIVVDRCRFLLAGFMKGDSSFGIQSIKIGRGAASWDTTSPGPPQAADTDLVDTSPETIAISGADITYLDAAGNVVAGPTHRLEITVTLPAGMPPVPMGLDDYPLREFGLFGAFGVDEYMIDYVRHPVIHKRADDTLIRTIRLVF